MTVLIRINITLYKFIFIIVNEVPDEVDPCETCARFDARIIRLPKAIAEKRRAVAKGFHLILTPRRQAKTFFLQTAFHSDFHNLGYL